MNISIEPSTICLSKKALSRQKRDEIIKQKTVLKKAAKKLELKRKKDQLRDECDTTKVSKLSKINNYENTEISTNKTTGEDLILLKTTQESENIQQQIVSKITNETTVNKKAIIKESFLQLCNTNFAVIIDCDWEIHHSERNIKSLSQQIMFSYGLNRRHSNPCNLYITGLGPKLRTQLSKNHFEDWTGVESTNNDYLSFMQQTNNNENNYNLTNKTLVYLTSDAEETLETLDTSHAYIIGGIVDRNRLKGATYKKAKEQNIKTVKLPIKENFQLAATHILTVNHVFEILLNFEQCGSWYEAMEKVLPKRKIVNDVEHDKKNENTHKVVDQIENKIENDVESIANDEIENVSNINNIDVVSEIEIKIKNIENK
jgi:tRNA (guanine9-N1)-methyltransferase